jgi:hypothetical protein
MFSSFAITTAERENGAHDRTIDGRNIDGGANDG